VRHAEPLLPDGRKRFVGRSDPPLSETGLEQARCLAEALRAIRFDSIHSSDRRRCLTTAEMIVAAAAGPGPSRAPAAPPRAIPRVQPDARLCEIDAGLWEGLAFEEAAARYPGEYAQRERDLVGRRFPGGESFRDLRDRVIPAFLEIVEKGGAQIVVVAHLGVNRVLLSELLGLPLEELFSIRQDYGCVNIIKATASPDRRPRFEVTGINVVDINSITRPGG